MCGVPSRYVWEEGRTVRRWAVHPCGCDITHEQARILQVAIEKQHREGAA
jgi:hypothetical protein